MSIFRSIHKFGPLHNKLLLIISVFAFRGLGSLLCLVLCRCMSLLYSKICDRDLGRLSFTNSYTKRCMYISRKSLNFIILRCLTRYKCCAQHNGRVANYCHVPLVIRRVHITSTPQAIHLLALCGEVINIHLRTKKDRSRSSIFELEIHPWYKFGINATNID